MSTELSETIGLDTSARQQISERVSIATPLATFVGVSFLYSYMVFHALHVVERDPQVVKLLSPIPLFATCTASAFTGIALGCVMTLFALGNDKLLARLPRLLSVAMVLFAVEIVLFP